MRHSKLERVEQLTRALVAREAELKANDVILKRATVRDHSLRAAIVDLRTTIAGLMGEDAREEAPPLSAAVLQAMSEFSDGLPSPTEGTILIRVVAHLDSEPRVFSAQEIADALNVGVDVVRTSLSKLFARKAIHRPSPGEYCALKHAQQIEAARRRSR